MNDDKKYAVVEYIEGDLKGKKILYSQVELENSRLIGNIGPFEKILAEKISLSEATDLLK